ncbi:PREDICTED: putative F-box protein At5g62660 [Ipomoea nil]|uniref:putative F-box protein At5g62660 n=1 Tax=Ipomoea nil TaxID=35883 RepID=UPI0009017CC1|nr:PREDICTED: putative F-box protein At5g62660 [Ipomoea nil]XP_019151943.1 PREDICTED: putative F-box protein At5g62660 [Ipomoea nil]
MSSSKMTKLSASALAFLPQEILVEILSKLPAKSLVRFKSVSKFFFSLLVDHPFADLHRNWSLTLPSRMSILIFFPPTRDRNTSRYFTTNYSEENQGKLQVNHLQYIDDDGDIFGKVYLRSALNGLLCFCGSSRLGDDIAIHNLSTRRHISLPPTYPRLPRDSRMRMNVCGLLGFDPVSRRYKVLKSVQFSKNIFRDGHVSVKHWVFTLGVDKSWREVHPSPLFNPYNCFNNDFYFHTSVHIDGIIYSLNSLNYSNYHIVAFDVRTENFLAMPLLPPNIILVVGLVEVDGRLALVGLGMNIWTLEESMVWKKQYSICIPRLLSQEIRDEDLQREKVANEEEFIWRNLFFVANQVGEIAVLLMLKRSVFILFYNLKTHNWRKFELCEFGMPLSEVMYHSTAMHFILDNIF